MQEAASLARQIHADLTTLLEAGEDLCRERRGIGVRLRMLLTMTDPSAGPVHEARLTLLTAIGRTEIGDQIRRGGGCHTGAEKEIGFTEDMDVEMLVDGLRRLGDITENPT